MRRRNCQFHFTESYVLAVRPPPSSVRCSEWRFVMMCFLPFATVLHPDGITRSEKFLQISDCKKLSLIQSAKLLPGSPFQPPEKGARLDKFDDYSHLRTYSRTDSHNTGFARFPCVSIGQINVHTHRWTGFHSQYRTMGADFFSHPALFDRCSVWMNPRNFHG